jgi:hypothetical protein
MEFFDSCVKLEGVKIESCNNVPKTLADLLDSRRQIVRFWSNTSRLNMVYLDIILRKLSLLRELLETIERNISWRRSTPDYALTQTNRNQ